MVTAAYPGGFRSFTDKVDAQDIVDDDHVNLLQVEVEAVQEELGLNPSGGHSTVGAFLAALNSTKYEEGNTLKSASGTMGAPGHGFQSEAGLGMLRPAPGTLAFSTNGVERLRLTGSGAVMTNAAVTGILNVTGSTTGIDHGATGGRNDDDHLLYSRVDAARPFTNPIGGVTPTSSTHLATKGYVDTSMPAGTIVFTGRATAPDGWLLCRGQTVNKADHPALFSAIGTAYGPTSTDTFTVPDLQQRFPLGKASSGTGSTLGGFGGTIDHAHSNPSTNSAGSHTHSNPNVNSNGSHAHTTPNTSTAGTHSHRLKYESVGGTDLLHSSVVPSGSSSSLRHPPTHNTDDVYNEGGHAHTMGNTGSNGSHVHSQSNTGSAGGHTHSQGSTGSHNPPYLVVNAMIKT